MEMALVLLVSESLPELQQVLALVLLLELEEE